MRSKLLGILLVLAFSALLGLHPVRAQNPTGSSDSNGNAIIAPAKQSDTATPSKTAKSDQAVPDSKREANNAIANDRGTVNPSTGRATMSFSLLAIVALLGLIGLLVFIRRRSVLASRNTASNRNDRDDYRRAA
ncbi:LPXTG cell wall anchor domain-containing protein [Candidatus Korobacter versatilis]|nr:LPXTG cell wall anchor domain-containing protein [Candidatus Koribacter versatilis]